MNNSSPMFHERAAAGRILQLLAAAIFGAVAGILLLFYTGLYAGHLDHQDLRILLASSSEAKFRYVQGNILLYALLKNPPLGMRVVGDDTYGTGGAWSLTTDGEIKADSYWSFILEPPPSEDTWPQVAEAIKESIYKDPIVNKYRDYGFKISDVEIKPDGSVKVEFVCFLPLGVIVPPKPKPGGVVRDLLTWLRGFVKTGCYIMACDPDGNAVGRPGGPALPYGGLISVRNRMLTASHRGTMAAVSVPWHLRAGPRGRPLRGRHGRAGCARSSTRHHGGGCLPRL